MLLLLLLLLFIAAVAVFVVTVIAAAISTRYVAIMHYNNQWVEHYIFYHLP